MSMGRAAAAKLIIIIIIIILARGLEGEMRKPSESQNEEWSSGSEIEGCG